MCHPERPGALGSATKDLAVGRLTKSCAIQFANVLICQCANQFANELICQCANGGYGTNALMAWFISYERSLICVLLGSVRFKLLTF